MNESTQSVVESKQWRRIAARLNAYERLIQDALNGDATLFMRSDEIERAWEIMDPLIAATEDPKARPPEEYPIGLDGPACAQAFLDHEGRCWL